jgi:hypothetical protein
MQIPDEQKSVPTLCYINGQKKTLNLEEAYVLFWILPFAWLLPVDWFRYHKITAYMRDVAKKSTKIFLMHLLNRGYLALTINDDCMRDKHGDPLSPNAFAAKAARLRKIFGDEEVPFIYEDALQDNKGTVQAYRMSPGQTWIVVMSVEKNSEYTDADIDWTIFQTPPDPKTRERVLKTPKEKGIPV